MCTINTIMAEPSIFEESDNIPKHLFRVVFYIEEAHNASSTIFGIIGMIFNLLVISIIVLSRELHLRRVLLWPGTGVSNILILVSYLMISIRPAAGKLTVHSGSRALCM